jgi:hypothetical protein
MANPALKFNKEKELLKLKAVVFDKYSKPQWFWEIEQWQRRTRPLHL